MRRRERPRFVVTTLDGLMALGLDDEIRRLGPDEAAALVTDPALPADRAASSAEVREGSAPTLEAGAVLVPPCPVALEVHDQGVRWWAGGLEAPVELDRESVRLLASAANGIPWNEVDGAQLARLVQLGLLEVRSDRDDASGGGYLRPLPEAPERDQVGELVLDGRVPVYSICASHIAGIPLGLGMLVSALAHHDGGRLATMFDLRPLRRETATTLAETEARRDPSVFLFSNYLWSLPENLELSVAVAQHCPGSVVVHGGPSTPKYRADAERFLDEHPEIDVLVLGEGEATVVELLDALGPTLDVDAAIGIPGTVVRSRDGSLHRGPERERVADLSALPSPYLSGLFDHLDGGVLDMMPVETNRGCPYGCTFCDWGSATNSRVRTFPLDRVFAELEWVARRGVGTLFICDANFGVLPRDLEIARHVASLKRRYGAPRAVLVSFAKNQTLRAVEIVREWIDAGIATEGSVALQTTDDRTLEVINRRNIRVERYDELTEAFRELGLPLAVDLMLGLPGSSVQSFAADLQRCVDGELTARIYPTMVLPNSPMNDPDYRRDHELVIDERRVVVGASSFDADDYAAMLRLRRIYRSADHFGVLRHVARWAQVDEGLPAVDLYRRIDELLAVEPDDWPSLLWVARHLARFTVPPPSWHQFADEVHRLLVVDRGLADTSALRTAVAVQMAHLPSPGRTGSRTIHLEHDYVAWFQGVLGRSGSTRAPLQTFGPGDLEVDDPRGVCGAELRSHLRWNRHPEVDSVMLNEFWIAGDWELSSPITRRLPQVITGE